MSTKQEIERQESWKPWINFVEDSLVFSIDIDPLNATLVLRKVLDQVPECYKILYALALSCAKWHPQRGSRRGGAHWTSCGLCVLFQKDPIFDSDRCMQCCPLGQAGELCLVPESLYNQWMNAYSGTFDEQCIAEKLYRLLHKLYAAEYRRVLG